MAGWRLPDPYLTARRLRDRMGPVLARRFRIVARLLCGLAVLGGLGALAGVEISSRPKFCTVCHYMQPYYDSWKESAHGPKSGHKGVACIECHYPPGLKSEVRRKFEASVQVVKYITRQYGTRPWTEIDDASCLRSGCHDKRLLSGTVDFNGVRFDHVPHLTSFRRVTQLRCTSCHSQMVQGTHMAATASTCYLCHFKDQKAQEGLARCTHCHDPAKLKGKGTPDKPRMDHTFVVDRGVSCLECHEDAVRGAGGVAREVCVSCHSEPERLLAYDQDRVDIIHANHVTEHKINCTVCHQAIEHGKPKHKTSSDLSCGVCHPDHHQATVKLYAGEPLGDLAGRPDPMSAAGVRCASCHRTHRDVNGKGVVMAGGAAGCMNCHGETYGRHLARWRTEIPRLTAEVKAGVAEARVRADAAATSRADAVGMCKEAYRSVELVRQGNGVHNVAYARSLLQSAAEKANAAMELIGSSYRVHAAAAPESAYESKCLSCHDAPPEGRLSIYGTSFSHDRHVTKNRIACERCHGTASLGEPGHGTLQLSRDGCRTCHVTRIRSYHADDWVWRHGRAGKQSCRVCHSESYCQDCHVVPVPHPRNWKRTHGALAAGKSDVCRRCHQQQDFCVSCHGTQMPHPDDWVLGKHGSAFRRDQRMCSKCHTPDTCATCHGVAMPHGPDWLTTHGKRAQKGASDCGSCHQQSDCLLCHKASPLPSHTGDWRKTHKDAGRENQALCSLCHGSNGGCKACHGVDLPHPDNWVLEGHKAVASFKDDAACFKCHDKSYCGACHELPQ